jgi:Ca2+/H+ antiporter, TMEM165/GDT1 family
MQSFFVSTSIVTLAEMGDKTQLLSLLLAARYRKPIPIILGILVATLLNHSAAGALGALLSNLLQPNTLNWIMVASFAIMAIWILIPDKLDESEVALPKKHLSIFIATVVAFFLAEMGDKTQVVTIALAARYQELISVVLGTTLGMMLANVPAVYLGHRFSDRLPVRAVHIVASLIFAVLALLALRNALAGTPMSL